ncbi:Sulfotransferase 2A [Salix suchowensis]|nr:Sulfotransferase 2A [Salix suchowensis]
MHGELASFIALSSFVPSPPYHPRLFSFVIFMETTTISSNGESVPTDEIQDLVAGLPGEKSWDGANLCFYKGVWYPAFDIRGAISFQQHFIARDTDIILASMPKSGTTWLKALAFSVVNRSVYSPKETPLLTTPPHDLVRFFEMDLYLKNLKEDTTLNLKKLAEFLGIPFTEKEEKDGVIEEISRLCSFDNLRSLEVNKSGFYQNNGPSNSAFFRKAKVGDWCNDLTPSMAERFMKIVEEKLAGSGLSFKVSE